MLLELKNIRKSFGGVHALGDVSFDLLPGEVHALVGENGAGKSTLIKVITGAHLPDEGTLTLNGQHPGPLDPLAARRLGIAAIYQQPALFPDLTVAENIALATGAQTTWHPICWSERRKSARELLNRVAACISPDAIVSELSMPEQQLVEIARAIGEDARILIMDEPTASLSDPEVQRLFEIINDLRRAGTGIIYVSHRLDEIFRIADRVTVLRDGQRIATQLIGAIDKTELVRLMVGREITSIYPPRTTTLGGIALEVKNVSCTESGLHDINLAVRRGEILGIAGLIGAGRTELARVLFGLSPADSGEIVLDGNPVTIDSPNRAIELGLAYVPEDRRRHGVILDLDVAANISLASLDRISHAGQLNFDSERALATQLTEQLAVKTRSLDTPVAHLSGGNQQKVALGRWLATKPQVLILDEPTQGVDIGAKGEIHRLMADLAAQGLAIILISSELPEVLGLADRIAVMRAGTIVAAMDRDKATPEKILSLALSPLAA